MVNPEPGLTAIWAPKTECFHWQPGGCSPVRTDKMNKPVMPCSCQVTKCYWGSLCTNSHAFLQLSPAISPSRLKFCAHLWTQVSTSNGREFRIGQQKNPRVGNTPQDEQHPLKDREKGEEMSLGAFVTLEAIISPAAPCTGRKQKVLR